MCKAVIINTFVSDLKIFIHQKLVAKKKILLQSFTVPNSEPNNMMTLFKIMADFSGFRPPLNAGDTSRKSAWKYFWLFILWKDYAMKEGKVRWKRERENFIRHKYRSTVYMNSTTIRVMWQVAIKGTEGPSCWRPYKKKKMNMKIWKELKAKKLKAKAQVLGIAPLNMRSTC